jgi:hypothetical protein
MTSSSEFGADFVNYFEFGKKMFCVRGQSSWAVFLTNPNSRHSTLDRYLSLSRARCRRCSILSTSMRISEKRVTSYRIIEHTSQAAQQQPVSMDDLNIKE